MVNQLFPITYKILGCTYPIILFNYVVINFGVNYDCPL